MSRSHARRSKPDNSDLLELWFRVSTHWQRLLLCNPAQNPVADEASIRVYRNDLQNLVIDPLSRLLAQVSSYAKSSRIFDEVRLEEIEDVHRRATVLQESLLGEAQAALVEETRQLATSKDLDIEARLRVVNIAWLNFQRPYRRLRQNNVRASGLRKSNIRKLRATVEETFEKPLEQLLSEAIGETKGVEGIKAITEILENVRRFLRWIKEDKKK